MQDKKHALLLQKNMRSYQSCSVTPVSFEILLNDWAIGVGRLWEMVESEYTVSS